MIYLITGKAGAGKTTLAYKLQAILEDVVGYRSPVLDGDEVRDSFPGLDFSEEGRWKQILRTSKIAALLERQGLDVIIALVAPRKKWRQAARTLFQDSTLIYLPGGTLWEGTEYEEPDDEELGC